MQSFLDIADNSGAKRCPVITGARRLARRYAALGA